MRQRKHTKQWELQAEVNSVVRICKTREEHKKKRGRRKGQTFSGWKVIECLEPKGSVKLGKEFLHVTYRLYPIFTPGISPI